MRYILGGAYMSKSEHRIQDEIRLALSEHGVVLRLNSGKFWQGKRVWSNEFQQYVLIDLRPVQGCPPGTSDLLFVGENNTSFIECKDDKGKPRAEQERFIAVVKSYGHRAGVARSAEEALKIIGVADGS
jgi:hypothetical protein